MRIVLDSNVIVAAFATRGLCAELFQFALESCEIVVSPEIVNECERILTRKLKVPVDKVEQFASYLKAEACVVEPAIVDTKACRDKADLHVLGVALQTKAKFIVTGDKDLLDIKTFKGTKIYKPRQFWTYLRSLKGKE